MIATVVDTKALLQVIWVSLVGGIGLSLAYSLVVLGLTRAGEARRAGHAGAVVSYYAVAAIGALVVALAAWRGYLFVVDKG